MPVPWQCQGAKAMPMAMPMAMAMAMSMTMVMRKWQLAKYGTYGYGRCERVTRIPGTVPSTWQSQRQSPDKRSEACYVAVDTDVHTCR